VEEEMISSFVLDFLETDPDYELLTKEEQDKTFGIYIIIMRAVYKASIAENIYPIIFANDTASKKVVEKAILKIQDLIPEVKNITVSLVN
jgi:hypothetical protein